MRRYLNARASGEPRSRATRRLGISWPQTTLLGIERQALTYAGHTVWNVHAERKGSGYGGVKRRPRAEWLTQRDTHPALISDDDAERLLEQLERRRSTKARAHGRDYLLSGLLLTSDNRQWHGDGQRAYRLGKGARIAISRIEPAVLDRIFAELVSPESIAALERAVRAAQTPRRPQETAAAQRRLAEIGRQVSRMVDLAGSAPDGSPYIRRVAELEAERVAIAEELALAQTREQNRKSADAVTTADIRRALAAFRDDLAQKRDDGLELEARAAISEFVERIDYEPGSESFKIRYRISGVRLASPRGFEPRYSP